MSRALIIILLLATLPCIAQQERITQLESLLTGPGSDTLSNDLKIKYLITLSSLYQRKSFIKSNQYGREALILSIKENNKTGEAMSLNMIGTAFSQQASYDSSAWYYQKSIDIFSELKDTTGLIVTINNLGIVYKTKGNYSEAIRLYNESLKLARKLNDENRIILTLNNLGIVYYDWKKYDYAIEHYNQAKELLIKLGDSTRLAVILNNLGEAYSDMEDYDKALNIYFESLAISQKAQMDKGIMNSYDNIADIYKIRKEYNKAKEYYRLALMIGTELGDKYTIAYTNLNLGEILLLEKSYSNALQQIKAGVKVAEEIDNLKLRKDAYKLLSEYYSLNGYYKDALKYYIMFSEAEDSLFNEESRKELAELQTIYETDKKENEIELLTKDNEIKNLELDRQQNQKLYIIFLSAFILAIAFLFYTRLRYRQKNLRNEILRSKLEIEQRLLRSQMSPHFIFNSLNSISSFISTNNPHEAQTFLAKFSKLIRYILENSRKAMVSMEDEINTIQLNLELEQMRFKYSFDFNINIDENIDVQDTYIPPLLFQPFVENAVIHGLATKSGKGKVEIDFKKSDNSLLCSITDNGIGRDESAKRKQDTDVEHQSLGLQVTKERMELLRKKYQADIKIEIVDLKDVNSKASGTQVKLSIPFEEE